MKSPTFCHRRKKKTKTKFSHPASLLIAVKPFLDHQWLSRLSLICTAQVRSKMCFRCHLSLLEAAKVQNRTVLRSCSSSCPSSWNDAFRRWRVVLYMNIYYCTSYLNIITWKLKKRPYGMHHVESKSNLLAQKKNFKKVHNLQKPTCSLYFSEWLHFLCKNTSTQVNTAELTSTFDSIIAVIKGKLKWRSHILTSPPPFLSKVKAVIDDSCDNQ